jgi:antitoxin MazE
MISAETTMKAQIGRWGNSFAVRLPKAFMERLGLHEGDEIDLAPLEAEHDASQRQTFEERRDAALERIAARRRPLPADWKFDREEANAR